MRNLWSHKSRKWYFLTKLNKISVIFTQLPITLYKKVKCAEQFTESKSKSLQLKVTVIGMTGIWSMNMFRIRDVRNGTDELVMSDENVRRILVTILELTQFPSCVSQNRVMGPFLFHEPIVTSSYYLDMLKNFAYSQLEDY